ncbi:uncharacterized protein LOC144116031 isoform X2 [Amblyomma americanum]
MRWSWSNTTPKMAETTSLAMMSLVCCGGALCWRPFEMPASTGICPGPAATRHRKCRKRRVQRRFHWCAAVELCAVVRSPRVNSGGDRRKTLCETPNYIAPEVLAKKRHSFEVDVRSIGCILAF